MMLERALVPRGRIFNFQRKSLMLANLELFNYHNQAANKKALQSLAEQASERPWGLNF
jgi:hypothetical protein